VDINRDSVADYTATVTAGCTTFKSYPAPGQILDPTDSCAGSPSVGSFCTQTQWDVQSHALPATSGTYHGNAGTDVTIHQGLSVVMSLDNAQVACP
jgi:hypothetical protein